MKIYLFYVQSGINDDDDDDDDENNTGAVIVTVIVSEHTCFYLLNVDSFQFFDTVGHRDSYYSARKKYYCSNLQWSDDLCPFLVNPDKPPKSPLNCYVCVRFSYSRDMVAGSA